VGICAVAAAMAPIKATAAVAATPGVMTVAAAVAPPVAAPIMATAAAGIAAAVAVATPDPMSWFSLVLPWLG
jgi:hypothetical protein